MTNVYIDPNSYMHLNNILFKEIEKYNLNNCREPYIFLKKYCFEKKLNLNTIDLWNSVIAKDTDIYVSFDHKFFLRKMYWKFKNRKYPIINLNKFEKKILFHFEPPVVMPEITYGINNLLNIYNKVFLTWNIGNSKINYFHTAQAHSGVFLDYWKKNNRLFLTMINSNRKIISRYKELLSERIKAVIYFSETNDIDLYGYDWDKPLFFPYKSQKSKIKKVYKGKIDNKYRKLSEYNFALAFENCELSGYITDKIFDCFYVGTIPVYLGAPDIENYIPKNCFINMRNFKNYQELRKFLKYLTIKEIQEYKENGRGFIESEKYKIFSKEYFAKIFLDACLN